MKFHGHRALVYAERLRLYGITEPRFCVHLCVPRSPEIIQDRLEKPVLHAGVRVALAKFAAYNHADAPNVPQYQYPPRQYACDENQQCSNNDAHGISLNPNGDRAVFKMPAREIHLSVT